MLSKRFRIPSKEIRLIVGKSPRYSAKYFTAVVSDSDKPSFAVVVSNKIDKRATVRNAIKRRMKEALSKNLEKLNHKKIIFFVKKEIKETNLENLIKEINKL